MKKFVLTLLISLGAAAESHAFCGFYVARADATLYNQASQVVLVRNENRTVISMMNDFKGDLKEFALVVPVPVVLEKGQVNVGEKALFEHIDAYSAPRLVEYFDENPCQRPVLFEAQRAMKFGLATDDNSSRMKGLGVKVEAQYTIGEYDIVILSAQESDGLETWLTLNGYKIPKGASAALRPYIRQGMKFFVAKVNIKEQAKTGLTYLRPLQFAFESEKFMLPIRLGMINAQGPQDLLIYVLTKEGRVETTNYRTVKLPTGLDLPLFVRDEFSSFYRSMFDEQVKREKMKAVFTEYFWNMGWCDPCAADPLSSEELRKLGVFWLEDSGPAPKSGWLPRRPLPRITGSMPVMVTRLHVRYSKDTFPEDLMFQETRDRENFQGRYVLRHPWKGEPTACAEAKNYLDSLPRRFENEAQSLANLTGWEIDSIRKKTGVTAPARKWWQDLWK